MNLKQYTHLLDAMKALIDVVEIEKENMLREAPTAEELKADWLDEDVNDSYAALLNEEDDAYPLPEEGYCPTYGYYQDRDACMDCNDDSCPHYKGE